MFKVNNIPSGQRMLKVTDPYGCLGKEPVYIDLNIQHSTFTAFHVADCVLYLSARIFKYEYESVATHAVQ